MSRRRHEQIIERKQPDGTTRRTIVPARRDTVPTNKAPKKPGANVPPGMRTTAGSGFVPHARKDSR